MDGAAAMGHPPGHSASESDLERKHDAKHFQMIPEQKLIMTMRSGPTVPDFSLNDYAKVHNGVTQID